MGKHKDNGDRQQIDLDNENIALAFAAWTAAQQAMQDISDRILELDRERQQCQRRLREAVYEQRLRWRALRRAQGYDVD